MWSFVVLFVLCACVCDPFLFGEGRRLSVALFVSRVCDMLSFPTGVHGSDAAAFIISLLLRLLYAFYFVVSLGFSWIVFLTMTFYMLAADQDAVTRVFATFAPRASESTVEQV